MNQATLFDTAPNTTPPITLTEIKAKFHGEIRTRPNWVKTDDEWAQWSEMLQSARNYMVGRDTPMDQYIHAHRSPLTGWQKLAYQWARQNPNSLLVLEKRTRLWNVYVRGEYVEFRLPHHDMGGERSYVTHNGRSKILVDLD